MAISEERQKQIADERKRQLMDAALKLFDQKGYAVTKISDITKEAGTSKGLFYHYFKTKEDILYAMLDRIHECIQECNEIDDAMQSLTLFTVRLLSLPYFEGYVPPIRVYFSAMISANIHPAEDKNPINKDFGRSYFGPIFARGQKQGYFKEGDPAEFGDLFWKELVGCMSIMNFDKTITEYHPDMVQMLSLFRK